MPDPVTLIDAAKLHDYFVFSDDIKDSQLTPHIGSASRRLKQWVGADAYQDALAEEPENADRKADLQLAEATLAMHFALPGLNTNITPNGVIKSARESQAGTIVSYLTPSEIKQLKQQYLDDAEEIARPYLLSDGTPESDFGVVEE